MSGQIFFFSEIFEVPLICGMMFEKPDWVSTFQEFLQFFPVKLWEQLLASDGPGVE